MVHSKHKLRRMVNADNLAEKAATLSDGWDKMPRWMRKATSISPLAKIVFMYLLSCIRIQGCGLCHPSIAGIAEQTGVEERAARRAMHELRSAGLITVDSRPGYACSYTLLKAAALRKKTTPQIGDTPPPQITVNAPPLKTHPLLGDTPPPHIGDGTPPLIDRHPSPIRGAEVDVVSREQKESLEVNGASAPETTTGAACSFGEPAPVSRHRTTGNRGTKEEQMENYRKYLSMTRDEQVEYVKTLQNRRV